MACRTSGRHSPGLEKPFRGIARSGQQSEQKQDRRHEQDRTKSKSPPRYDPERPLVRVFALPNLRHLVDSCQQASVSAGEIVLSREKHMQRLTTTPFGQRMMTHAMMEQAREADRPAEVPHLNKWELFRALCAARHAFGVTDRDLTVLNALLSFHCEANLSDNDNLIVFPSNKSLSERAHGMAESTLRRHLAALVQAGLIQRHDSPNGKRYAARGADGTVIRAFGFDLRPLLVQARRITQAAQAARVAAEHNRRLREEVSLRKRDVLKLVQYGRSSGCAGAWAEIEAALSGIHNQMRRNIAADAMLELIEELKTLMGQVHGLLAKTEKTSGSDNENERHYQNSNTDSHESEPCKEKSKGNRERAGGEAPPTIPLALVIKACPDILAYGQGEPRHWHELVALASFVRGMMGISPDAWEQAQRIMGPEIAAITVAAILQRVSEIASPGGYLRALTRKSAEKGFSPGPMVMALLRPQTAKAA